MIVVAFRLQEYTVQLTAARGRDSQEVTANTTSTLHEHERPRTNTVAAEVTWFKRSVCVCVCVQMWWKVRVSASMQVSASVHVHVCFLAVCVAPALQTSSTRTTLCLQTSDHTNVIIYSMKFPDSFWS